MGTGSRTEDIEVPKEAGRTDGRRSGLGKRSELIARRRLESLGWRILATNWRIRIGEIDLIALDGQILVFVEVKALNAGNRHGPISPALAVGAAKQTRLVRLAEAWLAGPGRYLDCSGTRFDVVGVVWPEGAHRPLLEHIEAAFLPDRR